MIAAERKSRVEAAARKGREAFLAGGNEADCPYAEVRKHDGRLTFARAWCNAWVRGFREQREASRLDSLLGVGL